MTFLRTVALQPLHIDLTTEDVMADLDPGWLRPARVERAGVRA